MRKSFAVPSDGGVARLVIIAPGYVAIPLIIKRAIVCPPGLLWRRVKHDITYVYARPYRHGKGLNSTIQVHVIESILIVPDVRGRVGHFIAYEPDPIVARIGLNVVHCCAWPSVDGRLHPDGRGDCGKCEGGCPADRELTIGDVVVHVALPGISLAPGVFMWSDVLSFSKVGRARILRCVQIAHCHQDPVGCPCMGVARVVVCSRWEGAGKGIDPRA